MTPVPDKNGGPHLSGHTRVVRTKLSGLSMASHTVEDGGAGEFVDPDGLIVQIGPS